MPHNITGSNVFTDPVPAYSDGDPVAEISNDSTIQALANRSTNNKTRLDAQHDAAGAHTAVTATSVAATADVSGATATFPAFTSGALEAHLLKGLEAHLVSVGASLAGGAQDLDFSNGGAFVPFIIKYGINTGVTPIIDTIKSVFSNPGSQLGLVLANFSTAGADTVIQFKHFTGGSYLPILTPKGIDVSYPVYQSTAGGLWLLFVCQPLSHWQIAASNLPIL